MAGNKRSNVPSDAEAADLAFEIARLETLFGNPETIRALIGDGNKSEAMESEIRSGPLATLLNEGEETALALQRARSLLAAYRARQEVLQTHEALRTAQTLQALKAEQAVQAAAMQAQAAAMQASLQAMQRAQADEAGRAPRWLRPLLVLLAAPIVVGVLVPPLVNLFTARQQLKLFTEQKALDSARTQADLLVGRLSALAIKARQARDDIANVEITGSLSQGQAERLSTQAIDLEQDFRASVMVHDFKPIPELRRAEIAAWSEVRALEDCLDRAANRNPPEDWKRSLTPGEAKSLPTRIGQAPCAEHFDAGKFEALTSAVNAQIAKQIGGALFPEATSNVK